MKCLLLKSAIIEASVIEADLNYIGSITIDEDLVEKANLRSGDHVLVTDHTNGNRLETYVIVGKRGSGIICMNGAAAHLINKGDKVTIMTFTWANEKLIPQFLLVDERNKFVKYM
ncbi:MAG: aspartate 1-decarboxylase [Nitrospirae bacterium]|nr:aspartate 1-decarboxylase [Nitrospirota bacterium]